VSGLHSVRIPLLERAVLQELSERWNTTPDQAVARMIKDAARAEVIGEPTVKVREPAKRNRRGAMEERPADDTRDGS
jgi:hypothetical protein